MSMCLDQTRHDKGASISAGAFAACGVIDIDLAMAVADRDQKRSVDRRRAIPRRRNSFRARIGGSSCLRLVELAHGAQRVAAALFEEVAVSLQHVIVSGSG